MENRGQRADRGRQDDRLELLLFSLGGSQQFGINVLKVKEVIPCPHLTHVPQSHPAVRGIAHLRGEPLSVVDLSQAVGRAPLADTSGTDSHSVIITEFNRTMQGFLVRSIDRIVVCDWKNVLPPPSGTGLAAYITGVTRVKDVLVQILDVERVLGEVISSLAESIRPSEGLSAEELSYIEGKTVMVVDDSVVARHKTVHTLEDIGVRYVTARDGKEALDLLRQRFSEWGNDGLVDMIISDIEMPEMDGYTLTREVRNDHNLAHIYILLHTSLNGAINAEKAHGAGANDALTKFVPEELAKAVVRGLTAAG